MGLKTAWAVIKGDRLNAEKALNRNAGIGLLLLGTVIFVLIQAGKIPITKLMTPSIILRFCFGIFTCFSWVAAQNDEIRQNKLLVIQGILGLLLISVFAVLFIGQMHSISHPEPGTEKKIRGVGYAPGLIGGALYYFGRHISDFSKRFKMDFNKYIYTLLSISIALEVVVIYKFIEALISFMAQF